MGRAARNRNKEKRAGAKRARKVANQEKYAALARAGQNKKSKRASKQGQKKKTVSAKGHSDANCGNIGCKKCNPRPARRTKATISHKKNLKNV